MRKRIAIVLALGGSLMLNPLMVLAASSSPKVTAAQFEMVLKRLDAVEQENRGLRQRVLDLEHNGSRPPDGIYRVDIDEPNGQVWICTPDYQRLVRLKRRIKDVKPSFFSARFVEGDARAQIQRHGRGRAIWIEN